MSFLMWYARKDKKSLAHIPVRYSWLDSYNEDIPGKYNLREILNTTGPSFQNYGQRHRKVMRFIYIKRELYLEQPQAHNVLTNIIGTILNF